MSQLCMGQVLKDLSNDARAALGMFCQPITKNDGFKIEFNTPSRIHPRYARAMLELLAADLVTVHRGDKVAGTIVIRRGKDLSRLLLSDEKKLLAAMAKSDLPTTED